ncbi:FKBP-type peptidyl-prolyl cis-trans isomerase [Marinomonas sp. 15G1-11]|uniref:Peptidyl-prolyl cis-trans isomerase n=1 Tax=Marinomonas phaeophyticola TaxID=3004091 RepID=A0ABT4JRW8_9GAMM|nr:FKBP-type peptidyl-prolyl cis-trans isomerase [Marinomonas sp. 15G1-11]MCZ2720990.1 FKBP-type peptidyl-prolyl cis-trans isomerase [Marinomonas sp. 15G1-11]
MKKTLIAALVLSSTTFAYADSDSSSLTLESKEQRLGYSVGSMFGGRMGQDFSDLDLETFITGFKDAYAGKELALTETEITESIQMFQQEQLAKAQIEQEKLVAEAAAKNAAWFAELEKTDGVMKTESGLMYKAITEGEGGTPTETDVVKVNYEGSLVDGTVFDSSYERGEPISFPLNQVIPGWTEGLQLMTVGSKYELYIPADLAYGPGGTGPIPPNSPLKFVVELLDIETEEVADTTEEATEEATK